MNATRLLTLALASTVLVDCCLPVASRALSGKVGSKFDIPKEVYWLPTDLASDSLSTDAVQLAEQLKLTPLLERLEQLRSKLSAMAPGTVPPDLRESYRDTKEEISEIIQATELDIEFTSAAVKEDLSLYREMLTAFDRARDDQINRTNAWSFRINGALWAVSESLAIPTYSRPRYSVSAGTLGILAGLIPSAFSLLALRETGGYHTRPKRLNMLAGLFGYSLSARTLFPQSVWTYLHSPPPGDPAKKDRVEQLIEHWRTDPNVAKFTDRNSRAQLDVLVGENQNNLTIAVLESRLTMLDQLDVAVRMINRPLLELMMVLRGGKHL